jgi:hypothetical protein
LRPIIRISICISFFALVLTGCSSKINQTGGWLVSSDSTLAPVYFDSIKDSSKVTTQQVNLGLATGASTSLIIGKVPWTEADLLIRFAALDPVDSAQSILSTTVTLYRAPYVIQPSGKDVHQLQFAGFEMDTVWNSTTFTWDSVNAAGYGTQNIITSSTVTDSTIEIQLDSSTVRQWVIATQDTNVRNNGFIIRPQNSEGVLSVYGPAYATAGYVPSCTIVYMKDGAVDTTVVSLSYATSVAQSSISSYAPAGPYKFVQAGAGERMSLVFDLGSIPKYSIINKATLTLSTDSAAQASYGKNFAIDTLVAYYIADPSTWLFSTTYPANGYPAVGSKNIFNVTLLVQHMLNTQNYGFIILEYSELNNANARFVYDENAPDSLKPQLTITYTPTARR